MRSRINKKEVGVVRILEKKYKIQNIKSKSILQRKDSLFQATIKMNNNNAATKN